MPGADADGEDPSVARPERKLQRALVTGASSGIGREFARQLAARGLDVVLVARRVDRLREVAGELESQHGVGTEVLPADLDDEAELAIVEERVASGGAPVDVVVNNAGFGVYGAFHELDLDRQTAQVGLNVAALVRLTHASLPRLVASGRGGVINVSSIAGHQPGPYGAVYAATKAFVTSFTEAVAEEVRGSGVRVLAVCPGVVTTEFQDVADVDVSGYPVTSGPEPVVTAALRAFTRGRTVVVPGAANKIAAAGSAYAPGWLTARFAARAHRGFLSGRQR